MSAGAIVKGVKSVAGFGLNYGLQAADVYGNYKYSRDEGKGVASSLVRAGAEFAFYSALGPYGFALLGAQLVGSAIQGAHQYGVTTGRENMKTVAGHYKGNFGGTFNDTQNAYTMRQRGAQAIQHSANNLNSVFGNEARTYYRGTR